MIYKEYGKTGKKISVIGFGGMRFKSKDYGEKAAQVVRKAFELGVNYFDTAPFYCDDQSEEIMGLAFQGMPKDQFYVSTKSMVYSEPDQDAVRRRIEKSLKRLGLSKIHFFHMWCIKSMDQYRLVTAKGGPLAGALKAKEAGLIEHIVFSTHCDGDDIVTMVNDGHFEGMTIGYNVINFPFREKGLAAAYEKGLGVVTMNPLSGGIIPQHPDHFDFIRERKEESVVQAALRFNISHREITCALAGMSSIEEVIENVQAGSDLSAMSEEKLQQIKGSLGSGMNHLCTGCGYCKGCPVDIDIPKYLDAYNMHILKNSSEEILNRLKWHWSLEAKGAGACIECGKCEAQCTQKLPIIQRLQHIAAQAERASV